MRNDRDTVTINLLHHSSVRKQFSLSRCIYIESLMSCHLLLNLLHELANIISYLPTNVINLVINDNEFKILFIT